MARLTILDQPHTLIYLKFRLWTPAGRADRAFRPGTGFNPDAGHTRGWGIILFGNRQRSIYDD